MKKNYFIQRVNNRWADEEYPETWCACQTGQAMNQAQCV